VSRKNHSVFCAPVGNSFCVGLRKAFCDELVYRLFVREAPCARSDKHVGAKVGSRELFVVLLYPFVVWNLYFIRGVLFPVKISGGRLVGKYAFYKASEVRGELFCVFFVR